MNGFRRRQEDLRREHYNNSVKSYFDVFDKIKKIVMAFHGLDEAAFTNWLVTKQDVLAGYKPIQLLKRNEILFILERYEVETRKRSDSGQTFN